MLKRLNDLEFYRKLGEALRDARLRANSSQDALAQIMGLSRVTLVNIEKGRQKVQLHNLVEAAHFLNVKLDDLIYNTFNESEGDKELITKVNKKFKDSVEANSVQNFLTTNIFNLNK